MEHVQLSSSTVTADQVLLVSTADRRLSFLPVDSVDPAPLRSISNVQDSPILSYSILWKRFVAFTSISGKLAIYDASQDTIVDQRKDHSKYGVHVISRLIGGENIIATAGWDSKIFLYRVKFVDDSVSLTEPFAVISLPSLPESILFADSPEDGQLYLLCARRDSSLLYYYLISGLDTSASSANLALSGKQNLAPYSNSWVAFSPAAISLCPTDPGLIAIATSSIPHMKVLIVRLLFPRTEAQLALDADADAATAAAASSAPSQSRQHQGTAAEARETLAVLVHCNTMTVQTRYSTPVIVWRPDGSGVWVNSEDGVVKGIETSTGKIVARLQGHDAGSKVRCLWAGHREMDGVDSEQELLISGGFDQKLMVWRVEA
jgi:WD40 repeat protein